MNDDMRHQPILRRARIERPVAALLAGVFLALSLAAGFHRGDHDDLGWLPERFHQHDFQWQPGADDARVALTDHCLACHLTRTLVRFTPPDAPLPGAPDPSLARAPTTAGESARLADFSRIPRAPPPS